PAEPRQARRRSEGTAKPTEGLTRLMPMTGALADAPIWQLVILPAEPVYARPAPHEASRLSSTAGAAGEISHIMTWLPRFASNR
ncbi:hypothetical protein, partial [Bradyrhizobium sp. CCBAU 11386]|uniref:hypothetical protein n=1 Tax=Bradyrhizobium sp. CCBAU 11386 TaxID=1630837 RepID=UPI002303F44F